MSLLRLSVRPSIAAVGGVAACFSLFDIITGSILSTLAILIVVNPQPSRWRSFEFAATIAWFVGVALITSDVSDEGMEMVCFFLPTGLLLGGSWLLRQASEAEYPQGRHTWHKLTLTPAFLVLAFVLWKTDLDFRFRLAVSEPALRAEARQLPRGVRKRYWPIRGAAGLFKVYEVEEKDGYVLWKMGAPTYFVTEGLAFLPMGEVPQWPRCKFRHIHGSWWVFKGELF